MKISTLAIVSVVAAALALQPVQAGDQASSKGVIGGKVTTVEPGVPVSCLTYDYLDLQYQYTNFDNYLSDGHGAGFDFSKSLVDEFYMTAGGGWSRSKNDHHDLDFWDLALGAGYYYAVTDSFHLNLEAGGTYSDADKLGSGWGAYVGPGFRFCVSERFEVYGNAHWRYLEGGHDRWNFELGAIYDIYEGVGVKLSGIYNENETSVLAGLRIYY